MNNSLHACKYRNFARTEVDRVFKIKDELLEEAANCPIKQRKLYLFEQAALRDTKAREKWDNIVAKAETINITVSDEEVREYLEKSGYYLGLKSINYNWWKVWLSNFKSI